MEGNMMRTFVFLAALAGCGSGDADGTTPVDGDADTDADADSDADTDTTTTTTTTTSTTTTTTPVWLPQVCPANPPQDPFEPYEVFIDGDRLIIYVGYGGGCRNHALGVCWDDAFVLGNVRNPLTLRGLPIHNANSDPCDGWIEDTVVVDLMPVRQQAVAETGQVSGTVQLELAGLGSFRYTY